MYLLMGMGFSVDGLKWPEFSVVHQHTLGIFDHYHKAQSENQPLSHGDEYSQYR